MSVPLHIKPLLDDSPLSMLRIKLAWPGLTSSERAFLLMTLFDGKSNPYKIVKWHHHRAMLLDLALVDIDGYVRYLASKHILKPSKFNNNEETPEYLNDKTRYDKVISDVEPLVQSARDEEGSYKMSYVLGTPAEYWDYDQSKRLALINGLEQNGEEVAELLKYATKELLPNGRVTIEEMIDVLLQYLSGLTLAERDAKARDYAATFYDGYVEYTSGKSVEALWNAIPYLPESLTYVLLEFLPERAGLESNLSKGVIDSLNEHQLTQLLFRNDIALTELRDKLYKTSKSDNLKSAAMSSIYFKLPDSAITELVYSVDESEDTGKKKIKGLAELAMHCHGASLVQMEAICSMLIDAPSRFHTGLFGQYDDIGFGKMSQKLRAKKLSPHALENEVFELRLFILATEVAPSKDDKTPYRLEQITKKDTLVPKNPWLTFLNFKSVVNTQNYKRVVGELPLPPDMYESIQIPGEKKGFSSEDEAESIEGEINLVNDVREHISEISDEKRAELAAISKAFSGIQQNINEVEAKVVRNIVYMQGKISKQSRVLTIITVLVVVGLLVILFAKR